MAKIRVKGTVLKQTITTTLTAVAQVLEFGQSGASSETYDSTTLDTVGAGKEYDPTGYSEGGTFDFSLFYDPALAGHQALTDEMITPATNSWSLTFADAATTVSTFNTAGVGLGFTGAMNDGLKADVSLKLTGLFGYAT
jgi:hypothetical protein